MKKIVVMCASLLASVSAFAALEPLDNQTLASIDGQAGGALKLELDLRLNSTGGFGPTGEITPLTDTPVALCTSTPVACRLGLRLNGQSDWLVLKGLSLSLRIPELLLETTDVKYSDDAGVDTYVSGVKASLGNSAGTLMYSGGRLTNTKPIAINLNVESIAFHSDSTDGATPGYRALTGISQAGATPLYTDGKYTDAAGAFDSGKEVGFLGLAIKGNIAMNGSVTTFACTGAHPRC